jgi:hypothetical protein
MRSIETMLDYFRRYADREGLDNLPEASSRSWLEDILNESLAFAKNTKLNKMEWEAQKTLCIAKRGDRTWRELQSGIADIQYAMSVELKNITLTFIPPNKVEYLEAAELFGKAVKAAASDELNAEIKAAGNCIAADLNTAAVFHLMRVVELGLRALGRHLKVPTCGRKNQTPIALGTWEQVIQALETKTVAVANIVGRSVKKQKDLEFYKGVILEFRAFKDIWRNSVSHCRCAYDEHQAMSALIHVRRFVELLAARIRLK